MSKMVHGNRQVYAVAGKNGVKGVTGLVEEKNVMEAAGAVVGRKFKKIDALPVEDRVLMMDMFYQGKSVSDIAANLLDMGHFKDVKKGTLEQYLYRFKWEIVDKQAVIRTEQLKEDSKAKLLDKVAKQYDVMEELAELISTQKGRLDKVLNREKDMPLLFNSASSEIKMLSALLQQYATMQFDLGYLRKSASGTMKITDDMGRTLTVESEGQTSVIVGTEQRSKIEDAARNFFDILSRRVMTDGNSSGHQSGTTIEGEIEGELND
jgi:hypothetical protein